MSDVSLNEAVDICKRADSFLITTHASPDGDAIGGMLAVRHFLHALGKTDVTCACHDPAPRIYDWLPGAIEIVDGDNVGEAYDLVIVIDVAQRERLGSIGLKIAEGQEILVLDHHREESPFGTKNFVDPSYSSASEIVVALYQIADIPMDDSGAICAYVGLITDTGSFRYSNTNAQAHRAAIALLETGIDAAGISAKVFDQMSFPKMALLRRVLERVQVSDCTRYAWSFVNETDLLEADAMSEDVDGLVNYVRNLEGLGLGMLFRELGPQRVKVSMRSRPPISSADILSALGGGGHAGAAGATLRMSFDEARQRVLERVDEVLGGIYT